MQLCSFKHRVRMGIFCHLCSLYIFYILFIYSLYIFYIVYIPIFSYFKDLPAINPSFVITTNLLRYIR